MKSQSQFLSNGRSLFSLNTVNTIQGGQVVANDLHEFYHQLIQDETYPNLCKIFFLQLVLRENVLIYSNRRVEIKEVWNAVNKRLGQKVGNIYIIDQLTKIQDVMANQSAYKRALLYDLTQISNSGLNFLLNNQEEMLTLTVVENDSKVIRTQLTDLFPFIFHYDGETEDLDLLGNSALKEKKQYAKFEKDKFYQTVTKNFNYTLQAKEEQGFLKVYLAILREKSSNMNIPVSRWKKMLKVLQFIGLTKGQNTHKRLSLTDCLLAPECLGRTCSQIQNLRRINQQVILVMLPYFGTHKWLKQLSSHFWVDSRTKRFFTSLAEKLRGKVSFFYPCSKYPEAVKLQYEDSTLFYRVIGYDKKLMSDKYYQIQEGRQYHLSLKYRSLNAVVMHFGVACYDNDKNMIHPVQICRFEETASTIQKIQGNRIICSQNMLKWKNSGTLAYQRCIGLYYDGNIDKFISIQDILYSESDSYSKEEYSGVYSKVDQDSIQLTEKGTKLLGKIRDRVKLGLTKVVNHFQGGTYAIYRSQMQRNEKWKQVNATLKGLSRVNSGKEFLLGTKYVRLVIMSNYNSGYPDFKIENKGAQVDLKDIQWHRS